MSGESASSVPLLVPLLYVCMCLCAMWNNDYKRVTFVINNFHQINTIMQGTVFIMPFSTFLSLSFSHLHLAAGFVTCHLDPDGLFILFGHIKLNKKLQAILKHRKISELKI